jgi:hypothetical protein
MVTQRMGNRFGYLWLATAVFLLLFALALNSLTQKSPTFDEQGFITRGLGYVRGENQHMRVGHPLGLNALSAVFLAGDDQVALPVDDPSWQLPNFHRPSELFLWEVGNDVAHVMFLARLPTLFLGILLTAVIGRWAWEITGSRWAGLLALSMAAFDPNLIAHSQLATTDLGLAVGATLAGYLLWRYWQRPSWRMAAFAGMGFGLLQDTKFTAGLFVPLFALVIGVGLVTWWRENGRFPTQILVQLLIAYPLAAFLTLWAAYGFQIGTLPDNLPTLPQLGGLTLPLSHHLEQLLDIGGRMQKGTPSLLLGQYSDSGWWYYFPVAFLLKTPLPTLLLLAAAFIIYFRLTIDDLRKDRQSSILRLRSVQVINHQSSIFLLIPSLGYFAIALTTDINLGYRHLLPVLPFLFVFIGAAVPREPVRWRYAVIGLVAWLGITTIVLHPDYLAYFNRLAGGPDGGWRYLVDSNIDWGQDLSGLKVWMGENGVDQVWLSYFGEARPEYYGVNYVGLDSYPPRLMNPEARPFYPHNPAPGIYAISVTNLQGVQFADHDQFAWFRDKEPLAKIGYSIFIYDVPAYGEPVDLALGGMQIDEIAPADYALLRTNAVTLRWFDPAQSLVIPQTPPRWLALAADAAVFPTFQAVIDSWEQMVETPAYALYHIPLLPPGTAVPLATFTHQTGTIVLMDVAWEQDTSVAGDTIALRTDWLKQAPPQPVKIFMHLTDASGNIVAQWDGLGAAWEGWRADDALLQRHTLTIPETAFPGTYQIWAGLYHPGTGERWQTDSGDRILLSELVIGE